MQPNSTQRDAERAVQADANLVNDTAVALHITTVLQGSTAGIITNLATANTQLVAAVTALGPVVPFGPGTAATAQTTANTDSGKVAATDPQRANHNLAY
jgi:hypothetical protein